MSEQTFKGKVVHVGATETIGEKGFRKRLLVLSDEAPEYPQEVPFTFIQDKTALLDKVKQGDVLTVSYNIRGNKYKEKWYCDLQGWKIETESAPQAKQPEPSLAFDAGADDLPF
jgi:hypothetical protein